MTVWNIAAAACSDRGRVRKNNEDAVAMDSDAGIFIVCDGMGGAAAGEVASRRTADSVLAALTSNRSANLSDAIQAANADLYAAARLERDHGGMGTTIVVLSFAGETTWVAHVGDSRCYRLRGNRFEQMTNDHSFVAEQVRSGLMTQAEAASSPMRNVITHAIGTNEHVEADLIEWPVADDDVCLLASDGLTREVSDDDIAGILRGMRDPEDACEALVAAANEAGGRDNVSCIVVRFRNRRAP